MENGIHSVATVAIRPSIQMEDELEIPDLHLFMICEDLDRSALTELPAGYHIRNCRKDELAFWKAMPFDDPAEATQYDGFMTEFFDRVYAPAGDLFFETCRFVCDSNDHPIATAFIWKAYNAIHTFHWLKVLKPHEGKGIGRALVSRVMIELKEQDFPVYLHTHPSSFRAVKLYSDFGFKLLTDPVIGRRKNDLEESWPILEKHLPPACFGRLVRTTAPKSFLATLASAHDDQF